MIALRKNSREEIRVSLDEFKGTRLVDLRLFSTFTAANVPMPTKKGVSLSVAKLGELIDGLEKARAEAVELGWIGADDART
jgi:hypothetical protein